MVSPSGDTKELAGGRAVDDENTALLRVEALAKDFSGVHALTGASFDVKRGGITGLIGPNGAGKSTAVDVISGFLKPTAGHVIFNNVDVTGWPAYRVARRGLVRTFQLSSEFSRLTVMENLLAAVPDPRGGSLGGALLGKRYWRRAEDESVAVARDLLGRFGLNDAENAYAGELSGGQKRLLEIVRGLMGRPQMLLLDEPFAGVNPSLALQVEQVLIGLRDDGLTMVLVEHEMGVIERLCDTIVVMALGQVLTEGSMAEIRANQEVIDAYLAG